MKNSYQNGAKIRPIYIFWIIVSAIAISTLTVTGKATAAENTKPYNILVFIDIDNCVQCEQFILRSTFASLKRVGSGKVWAILSSESSDDCEIYKKNISADSIICDAFSITERFGIKQLPACVVCNAEGVEIYRCENIFENQTDFSKLEHKIRALDFNDIPYISLENKERQTLARAIQPIIDFRSNILYTVDELQNEIAEYSIISGKRITTIKPNEKLSNIFGNITENPLFQSIKEKNMPFATFRFVSLSAIQNKICAFTSVFKGVRIDSTIMRDGTISKTKNYLQHMVNAVFANDTLDATYIPATREFTLTYPKYRYPLHYANCVYGFPNPQAPIHPDSLCAFFIGKSPDMSEGNFFLKYSRLKKEYNLTEFNLNTSGILEYNDNQKSFIYANPWNSVFCKIYEPDSIIKFNFQGSFNSIITNSSKHNWPQQDTVQYFINDIQSNSDNFFILFQTFLGNRRSSNYYLLQKYDWNGKLLVETPVISAQEPILRINLAGCTDDTLYVLVKLAKQGYILQKMPLR